ncbi:transporter [Hoyosella sp. YIM 151337]|uniref:PH-like domain-containing protein n=1 Tax=Hoyosella sp. YIM 151337 TaxID=2992742 RepID=UPI0022355932|nr:transporter [Hoyosella sp. YIM 151337]MCW4353213.1 transporter [Hoyosella sp. YIM 151337]
MTRTLLTVLLFAIWILLVWLMIRSWRRRGERQRAIVGALPEIPGTFGAPLLGPSAGLYVGSTLAPSWINRVAVDDFGDRAEGELTAYDDGLLLTRSGASTIWMPREQVLHLRTDAKLAGKVMTRDGLLVIRWRTSTGAEIDSGFRAVDKLEYHDWVGVWDSGSTRTDGPGNPERNATNSSKQDGKNGVDG